MDASIDPARARPLGEPFASAIRSAFEDHQPASVAFPDRRQAAVLILLFERDGEPWVVLTERTEHLRSHSGEISFPGGSRDPDDPDLWTTAVRETVEELGIDPNGVVQLGRLDDYPTFSSGFVVTPYVATHKRPGDYRPSPYEIAQVIELPLRALAEIGREEIWDRGGIRFPMHVFEMNGHYVWGVTAFILRRFLDIVGPALGFAEGSMVVGSAVAQQVVRELAERFAGRFDWVGIYWVDGDELVLGPYIGLPPDGHERIKIPEGVCGAVAASGQTEVVPDVRARPGHIACDLNTRSEVVAPIRLNGRVVGVLDVDSNTLDAFGEDEVRVIEDAAERIARG